MQNRHKIIILRNDNAKSFFLDDEIIVSRNDDIKLYI